MSDFSENQVLQELLQTGISLDQNGRARKIHSQINRECAQSLYETVLSLQPKTVLEVGMGFGISSLAILSALQKLKQTSRLISVDPYQSTEWYNCGLVSVQRANLQHYHKLIENFDFIALPTLLAQGTQLDLAYVDGWHTFDYALIDFWYIDKMLRLDGVIAFNDCGLPSIKKVISFLFRYREYNEIDVGLAAQFAQDRYFRKAARWELNWDFFKEF